MKQSVIFTSEKGDRIMFEVSDKDKGIVTIKNGNSNVVTEFSFNDFSLMTDNVKLIIRSVK